MLQKYLTIFWMNWQAGLAYPLSFGLWRFRQLLTTLMSLSVWSVIFAQNANVFGYSQSQMTSYVFVVAILQGAILSTNLHSLAGDIYSGNLSQLIIKPIKLFRYFVALELSDKLKNVIFIFLESVILYFIFKPTLVIPNLQTLIIFIFWILLGVIIHFFIEILFGTLGFWSPQTWGPKFLFFMIVDATAGKLFPLDILPSFLQRMLFFTPFPYLAYAQSQLFLGRISQDLILGQTLALLFWCCFLGFLAHALWNRGMKEYSAAGQ